MTMERALDAAIRHLASVCKLEISNNSLLFNLGDCLSNGGAGKGDAPTKGTLSRSRNNRLASASGLAND